MTRERFEIRRLRLENLRLRRELGLLRTKLRRLRALMVPIADYEELSDLAGHVTDLHVCASRRQRQGREKQAKDAIAPRELAQKIYNEKRAAGHSKERARQLTSFELKRMKNINADIRDYTPGTLRKFLEE